MIMIGVVIIQQNLQYDDGVKPTIERMSCINLRAPEKNYTHLSEIEELSHISYHRYLFCLSEKILGRLRNPVGQTFLYEIRYVFIVTHSSLNHNENMPHPV